MLDFRVETFLTVCQTMNYTTAANLLHITQPAVSGHIRFLEEKYNTKLFAYKNKQLFLTQSGEILKAHLITMKNDEKNMQDEIKSCNDDTEFFSLGVTMTVGEYAIVDKMANFLLSHPQMNMHIHYGNTSQLLKLLDEGQINLAIVEGNYPHNKYSHKKYSTEEYIAVSAENHNFAVGKPERVNDLLGERLLVREKGSGTRNILENSLTALGLQISDFVRYTQVENMHTIISLLKKDCGISFMYKIAVEDELKAGVLKEIKLNDFKILHDFDFIWEKDSVYSNKYLSFCEEFAK